jgi:hypothetical protein
MWIEEISRGLFRKDRERLTVKLTQSKYKNPEFARGGGAGIIKLCKIDP